MTLGEFYFLIARRRVDCGSTHAHPFILFFSACLVAPTLAQLLAHLVGGIARQARQRTYPTYFPRHFDIGRHSQLISQPCPPIQPWAHQTRSGIQTAAREQVSIGGYCCCPADPPTLSPRSSPPLRILCCRLRYHSSRVSLRGTLTSADRLRILIAFLFSQINSVSNSRTPSRPSLSRRSE